jgi:two-component system KDP operon response regulator KdpE
MHLPRVQVDPLKIERVLQNILANSIKFSPPKSRIRVFAQVIEKEIQVGVEDQGIGISPEHLPHIFEKFYRADKRKEGIGLGLYIAQQLIDAHGGRTWAESQPGRGTTIYFTLPLNDTTPLPEYISLVGDSTTIPGRGSLGQRHRSNGSAKILIVDDAKTCSSLEPVMRAEGFEILTTAYGKKAIKLIQSQSPDLLLLELSLPDIDGLNFCEQIRRFSNIPIIVITNIKAEYYQVQALESWADDYLVKSFSYQELLARIRAVLRRSRVPSRKEPPAQIKIDGFVIDPHSCEVETPQGKVKLTLTEHKLLYYLASNPGRVLTHEQLLTRVWGDECEHQPDYLWVTVSRLRKKIEPNPAQPRYIFNEPGVGYSFTAG